ncbi:MAG: RNA-binding protein [Deltaproteobacteria bacterium RIFOXYD12_FULL_50_9]|nr:MAG: RNA-binding protein [Deltaproteobacteria bacterium RIFOXYD12_FULL_50_9]
MLTGKQLRYLRGLGHHLVPTVMLGKEGITENLLKTTEQGLTAHELIKAKVMETCPEDRRTAAATLAEKVGAVLVQVLGRTFLLYRQNPESPAEEQIVLPK